ncbi:hypothetical protein JAAARDRAFT_568158 [Jaapia argillacea MUCL 33604]|uniref:RlpA-like protein double-psi beta-barrel domain-containing protein n=1 Tax=Jaapia argillacea MUCL 33604 TaxID=933084 RepID=A0A067Q497_9AGAM|nr:hypothetical protein JAAARDRAFT_568158 [Jaapia argillacea MUCL 33604]
MFQLLSVASIVLVAASTVSGLVVPRATPPPGYDTTRLESYNQYHTRYLALSCQTQHGTTFFDQCCHPLLATEQLSSLPAQCTPSDAASISASAAEPTSTVVPEEDPECTEDGETSTAEPTPTETPTEAPAAVAPSPTHKSHATTSDANPETTPAPAPETTPEATSTTTKTPKASPTPASSGGSGGGSSGGGQSFSDGVATFFLQNGQAGACGQVHADSDFIAAIDVARYGDTGVTSPLCGQQVFITNQNNGKSVTVTIADACPTCNNGDSIDLSVGAFTQIATEEEGEVPNRLTCSLSLLLH